MTIDKAKLKALAEALIKATDAWHENEQDNELGDLWHVADDNFTEACTPTAVLALLAEIDRLEMENRSLKGSCSKLGAEHAGMSRLYKKANRMQFEARQERDQLKAENEALRSAALAAREFIMHEAEIRGLLDENNEVSHRHPRRQAAIASIDAAMAKEASR